MCDYEDRSAREAMIDALAKDAHALLGALDGRLLPEAVTQAARLLATVVGQDLDLGEDGTFRIARRVAKDRVISTVDPDARHGHETAARGFDGYKGHVALDPDSELITATTVTAGNVGDAGAAAALLGEDLPDPDPEPATDAGPDHASDADADAELLAVYGDAAYGAGALVERLERGGADIFCKVQPPVAPGGRYSKDAFGIDLDQATVTCPAGHLAAMRPARSGHTVRCGQACTGCPLAPRCTAAKTGRTIYVGPYEAQLARARARQADPAWKADYTQTRPKVERKIGHLMRRKHGGRRARVRGQARPRSTPTSGSWPPPSTSAASPCSD